MLISFFTVVSTIFIMNQPEMSTSLATIMKSLSTVILVLIGVFLYNEQYSMIQLYGVFLTIIGIVFITSGKKK
jgi:drug/metabolite transporter (DMT)-like permease